VAILKERGIVGKGKDMNANLLLLLIVCRLFVFDQGNIKATQININEWIKDKEVISVTQSSSTIQHGLFYTCITIIAEDNNER